ncbi:MAG: hypothetical protein WCQ95_11590 [Bacteroidota bacterium]
MKTKFIFIVWIVIIIIQSQILAQNQSIFLPFSGDTYPVATGTKMINFTNPGNPVVQTLPWHVFEASVGGNYYYPADPHIEGQLENATPSMDEMYLGQHPMFAQQVVHDKDGNLLFFIVDNNIYNRYGKSFLIDPYYPQGGSLYLHDMEYIDDDNIYTAGPFGVNYTRFGYNTGNSYNQSISMDPEFVVFPIHNSCYKFGIVYSIYDNNSNSGSTQVFY